MRIAVCWKWVSLDRDHDDDERWSGVSAADEAALEVALRIAERSLQGRAAHEVAVWCLGPAAAMHRPTSTAEWSPRRSPLDSATSTS